MVAIYFLYKEKGGAYKTPPYFLRIPISIIQQRLRSS